MRQKRKGLVENAARGATYCVRHRTQNYYYNDPPIIMAIFTFITLTSDLVADPARGDIRNREIEKVY